MSESETNVFVETVEGIGQFTFRQRNMRLEIQAKVERQRLSEGVALEGDAFLAMFIEAIADLKIMIVDGPPGWKPADLDELDPFDDESYTRTLTIWGALRGKEETFRRARKAVPRGGQGGGSDLSVLVPENLQPVGDRPEVP